MRNHFFSIVLFFLCSSDGVFADMSPMIPKVHQINPAVYLKQNPEQQSLLLFHALGSGKTVSSIYFAEQHQESPVLIIVPKFLMGVWRHHLATYPVKNINRYHLTVYEDAKDSVDSMAPALSGKQAPVIKVDGKLIKLSQALVILDEVHKFVGKVRRHSVFDHQDWVALYFALQSSKYLLALTGTPIFSNVSDIAFIANLLQKEVFFPLDTMNFQAKFMKIQPHSSFFRGHLTESKLVNIVFPITISFFCFAMFFVSAPLVAPLVSFVAPTILPTINNYYPVVRTQFREFDSRQLESFSSQYISYYAVSEKKEAKDYPRVKTHTQKIEYTPQQLNFFLNFMDATLSLEELKILLDDASSFAQEGFLKMNLESIIKGLLEDYLIGRQIGNLEFPASNPDEAVSEPPKFLNILKILQSTQGQVVVYSNYYHKGVVLLKHFLERHGYAEKIGVLDPDMPLEGQTKILNAYNTQQIRILLLHPDLIEGISLLGTEQLHILEPIESVALERQVIGRVVRFNSHAHLPYAQQEVNVYLWECEIKYVWDAVGILRESNLIRRDHWQRKHAEVNPSNWQRGILDLDTLFFLKDETPDKRCTRLRVRLCNDIESFTKLAEEHNIEKSLKN